MYFRSHGSFAIDVTTINSPENDYPDLTTIAKIVLGGMLRGAVAGRALKSMRDDGIIR